MGEAIGGDGGVARLLVFWDYDTQWGADRTRLSSRPANWGELEFENTERLLALHAEYEVPACFAVVGAAARAGERPYHDPAQVRRMHACGHEVASHGYVHEWLPALGPGPLRDALSRSKESLEQCLGTDVVSFVPPFNQPFDYPRGWSFSLAERRACRDVRTDLGDLCRGLTETGFRFCRVAYRPIWTRLAERATGRRLDRPGKVELIEGVACVRLNTPGGFDGSATAMLDRVTKQGGLAVVYGHPHSLHAGNTQDVRWLVPFLEKVRALSRSGRLKPCRPRDLLERAA
jgi:peptidoglycan/xylan/chitin deacetylase (PgdA/CDA1 family)